MNQMSSVRLPTSNNSNEISRNKKQQNSNYRAPFQPPQHSAESFMVNNQQGSENTQSNTLFPYRPLQQHPGRRPCGYVVVES